MKKTFMSYVFGCRVNEAEKQILDQELFDMGFTWNDKHPSFYIINSCAVTGKAEREVRQHIYQTRKKFPRTKILVTGCSATLWINTHAIMREVDYWIDNTKKDSIPNLLNSFITTDKPLLLKKNTLLNDKFLKTGRVFIKIQDGCDRFCTYCIVPHLRKIVQSVNISTIINLVNSIQNPINEVVLTAINTELYGQDTGENLIQLLDSLLQKTNVNLISFGSIHVGSITPNFLHWYKRNANNPRFLHFFHIPIQSGSDYILKKMNRHYTINEFESKINTIHTINPKAIIATDVIVGFPGETDEHFEDTYTYLKHSPISKFHVFRYSPRKSTVAETFGDTVSYVKKKERSKRLIDLGKEKIKLTT